MRLWGKMSSIRKLWTYGCLASFLSFSTSVFILAIFPSIYKSGVAKMTNLVEGSFLYPLWKDLPLPIYKRLYFFNITNAKEFLLNGTTMEVDEVGPYTYVGRWIKEDIWHYPEGTVSYREVKTFHFVREESVGDEDDEIYSLNGPYIVAADYLKSSASTVRKGASKIFNFLTEKLVVKKSIKELAFGGYKDPIMRFGKFFRSDTPYKEGKFSWLTGHNATDDGEFEVSTGQSDHSSLNMIKRWNGFSDLMFWKNDSCNELRGTNAEFGPPLRADQTEYTFFQPIFCRSITFRGNETVNHKGIDTRRFENHKDIFSKKNPENSCFEISPELGSGALDVSPCQFGAPVVLTFPHFYLADPSFLEKVNGLEPNKEDHGSHIDAEIITGVSVDISIKFQMNIKLDPVEHFTAFRNATPGVYPIFWLEILVELPDNLIETIHYQLFRPRKIVHGVFTFLLVLSTIVFVICFWRRRVEIQWENFAGEKMSLVERTLYLLNSYKDYEEIEPHILTKDIARKTEVEKILDSFDEDDDEVSSHVEMVRTKLFRKSSKKRST